MKTPIRALFHIAGGFGFQPAPHSSTTPTDRLFAFRGWSRVKPCLHGGLVSLPLLALLAAGGLPAFGQNTSTPPYAGYVDLAKGVVTYGESIPTAPLPEMTVATWLNRGNQDPGGIIAGRYSPKTGDCGWFIGHTFGSMPPNCIRFMFSSGERYGSGTVKDGWIDRPILPGEWVHVAIAFNRGSITAYINGAATPVRFTHNNDCEEIFPAPIPVTFGGLTDGTTKTVVSLDEFRLFNRALPAQEIASLSQPGGGGADGVRLPFDRSSEVTQAWGTAAFVGSLPPTTTPPPSTTPKPPTIDPQLPANDTGELVIQLAPGFGAHLVQEEDLFPAFDEEQISQITVVDNSDASLVKATAHRWGVTLGEGLGAQATGEIRILVRATISKKNKTTKEERLLKVKVQRESMTRPAGKKPMLTVFIHGFSFWWESDQPEWILKAAAALEQSAKRLGVDPINGNLKPVLVRDVEAVKGADYQKLLSTWGGSKDVLACNASDLINNGVSIDNIDSARHHAVVEQIATSYRRLIEAWIDLQRQQGNERVSLMIVGHSFGTMVGRELVGKLAASSSASSIDNAKCIWLDPVAVKPDADSPGRFQNDIRNWYHPEFTGFVTSVTSYIQDSWPITWWISPVEGELEAHTPIDGEWAGGPAGFFNSTTRVYRFTNGSLLERGRYRHHTLNQKLVDGHLNDMVSLPSGAGFVTADSRGQLRVVSKDTFETLKFIKTADRSISISVDSTGQSLAVATREPGNLALHDLGSGTPIAQLRIPGIRRVAFIPGSTSIAAGTSDGDINLVRKTGSQLTLGSSASHLKGSVSALAPVSGKRLLAATLSGELALYDTSGDSLRLLQRIELNDKPVIRSVAVLSGGEVVVAAGRNLLRYRFVGDRFDGPSVVASFEKAVRSVAVDPSGNLLVGGNDRMLRLLTPDGQELAATGGGTSMLPIRKVVCSAQGDIGVIPDDLDGGPVNDVNVNTQVRVLTDFVDRLKTPHIAHTHVPDIWIDFVVGRDREPWLTRRYLPDLDRPARLTIPFVGGEGVGAPVAKTNITSLVLFEGAPPTKIALTNLLSLPGTCELQLQVSNPGVLSATGDDLGNLVLNPIRAPKQRTVTVAIQAANDVGEAAKELDVLILDDVFSGIPAMSNGIVTIANALNVSANSLRQCNTLVVRAGNAVAEINKIQGKIDLNAINAANKQLTTASNAVTVARAAADKAAGTQKAAAAALATAQTALTQATVEQQNARAALDSAEDRLTKARNKLANAKPKDRPAAQREVDAAKKARDQAETLFSAAKAKRLSAEATASKTSQAAATAQQENLKAQTALANAQLALVTASKNRDQVVAAAKSALEKWSEAQAALSEANGSLLSAKNQLGVAIRTHAELKATLKALKNSLGDRYAEADKELDRIRKQQIDPISENEANRSTAYKAVAKKAEQLAAWINTLRKQVQ